MQIPAQSYHDLAEYAKGFTSREHINAALESAYGDDFPNIRPAAKFQWNDSPNTDGTYLNCMIKLAYGGQCGTVTFTGSEAFRNSLFPRLETTELYSTDIVKTLPLTPRPVDPQHTLPLMSPIYPTSPAIGSRRGSFDSFTDSPTGSPYRNISTEEPLALKPPRRAQTGGDDNLTNPFGRSPFGRSPDGLFGPAHKPIVTHPQSPLTPPQSPLPPLTSTPLRSHPLATRVGLAAAHRMILKLIPPTDQPREALLQYMQVIDPMGKYADRSTEELRQQVTRRQQQHTGDDTFRLAHQLSGDTGVVRPDIISEMNTHHNALKAELNRLKDQSDIAHERIQDFANRESLDPASRAAYTQCAAKFRDFRSDLKTLHRPTEVGRIDQPPTLLKKSRLAAGVVAVKRASKRVAAAGKRPSSPGPTSLKKSRLAAKVVAVKRAVKHPSPPTHADIWRALLSVRAFSAVAHCQPSVFDLICKQSTSLTDDTRSLELDRFLYEYQWLSTAPNYIKRRLCDMMEAAPIYWEPVHGRTRLGDLRKRFYPTIELPTHPVDIPNFTQRWLNRLKVSSTI